MSESIKKDTLAKLFGLKRRSPADEIELVENVDKSDAEYIDAIGASILARAQEIDEGQRVVRKTRYQQEAQIKGRILTTTNVRILQVNQSRLADRLAYGLFSYQDNEERQLAEGVRNEFDNPAQNWVLNVIKDALQHTVDTEEFAGHIEALIDRHIRRVDSMASDYLNDHLRIINDEAARIISFTNGVVNGVFNELVRLIKESCQNADYQRAAALLVGQEHLRRELADNCQSRASELQQMERQQRAAIRLHQRVAQAPTEKLTLNWRQRIWKGLRDLVKDNDTDSETTPDSNHEVEMAFALGVKSKALVEVADKLRTTLPAIRSERARLEKLLEIMDAKLRKSAQWLADIALNQARVAGVTLEQNGRVIDELLKGLEPLGFFKKLNNLPNPERCDTRRLLAEVEAETRQKVAEVCTHSTLVQIVGQLSADLQQEIIGDWLGPLSLSLRKVDTAAWSAQYTIAVPGGQANVLGYAIQQHPSLSGFRILEYSGNPNLAIAQIYVPFIKPTETFAYVEGREAIENLRATFNEKQWLAIFPFEALAEEADAEVNEPLIDEIIVKGVVTGTIQPSQKPMKHPFYLSDGQTGGKPVWELSPEMKATLQKIGDSIPDMRRTLSKNSIFRREILEHWEAQLQTNGRSHFINNINQALANDKLPTLQLREAASRLLKHLSKRGER